MSSGRDAVRLTDEELTEFLESNMKVQVATNGPDGHPHLTTLFYVMVDGQMFFWTYGKSQKIQNLRRDPRVTCLVEDGTDYFELRGATIFGKARLIEDYDQLVDLGGRVATVMANGEDLGEFGAQIVAQQARKRVGVIVEPEKIASWDHRKMTAPPGGN
ncbi:MAG: pyridoxamine 5'-phosphate oxidase family protein [Nocardioidaceae bacterium]|nr:pyridoxamine 5'-phosphate oxidase family protein [Nocardioidaceae bacterium]